MLTQAVKNKLISNSKLGYIHPVPYRQDARIRAYSLMDEETIKTAKEDSIRH